MNYNFSSEINEKLINEIVSSSTSYELLTCESIRIRDLDVMNDVFINLDSLNEIRLRNTKSKFRAALTTALHVEMYRKMLPHY